MIFYDISDAGNSCVDIGEGNEWEGIYCPENEGHQRAGKRVNGLKLKLALPKVVDFSWTILSDILITERVVEAFKKAGLKGYEVEPASITLQDRIGGSSTNSLFWELIITGTAGYAHPDSGIVLKNRCDTCGLMRYSVYEHGIIVNEDNWDGSDLFTVVEYPKHVIVNEKVKRLIEKNRFTNVRFVKSDELKWPDGVIKP